MQETPGPGLEHLPEELQQLICSYLSADDLWSLRLVNRKFSRLANDPRLWRQLYQRQFLYTDPLLPDEEGTLTFVDPNDCGEKCSENVWRRSYQLLKDGVHVYPEEDTSAVIRRCLDAAPDALVLLHPGRHVLRRPLHITSSPRILGLGSGPVSLFSRMVCLDVRLNAANLTIASPASAAQVAFLTVGFRQIGPARAPLQIRAGARPTLLHCTLTNSSQTGWALVVTDPETAPRVRRCAVPDGVHNGLLVSQAGGRFEENEFGRCRDVCLKMVASSAVFDANWVRPGNRVEVCECRGLIGGEVLPGMPRTLAVGSEGPLPPPLAWRAEQGWRHWDRWPPCASPC